MADELPLLSRYPALSRIPRAQFTVLPSPLEPPGVAHSNLWIKRDDLNGEIVGGNKVRALEFLLGGVRTGDRVVTVGSAGSTHALATATLARHLGAEADVGRWRQEMNGTAARIAEATTRVARVAPVFRTVVGAYAWAWRRRMGGARWIPAGGSSPLGALGQVNAALELCEQMRALDEAPPASVIVPLGTGGTMAGLALGFAIAGVATTVVGVRVVPRIVARLGRVAALANDVARLIERASGQRVPRVDRARLTIAHDAYGGAYGRETPDARDAAERLRLAAGIQLDATYSAKAFVVALQYAARERTLFWLTFDSRTPSIR